MSQNGLISKTATPLQITADLYHYVLTHSTEPAILTKCREETTKNKNLDVVRFLIFLFVSEHVEVV
jgi:hypothetical protein